MPALDPQVLFDETVCYPCVKRTGAAQRLRIALERRVLLGLNPAADVTQDALVAYGQCFECAGSTTQADILELAILDQIAQLV